MSRKKKIAINEPKKVGILNLEGAYLTIGNLYIRFYLRPKQRKLEFKIDGRRLWEQLKNCKNGSLFPVGDLSFKITGVDYWLQVITIEPDEDTKPDFPFEIEVQLREFKNALCGFLKF